MKKILFLINYPTPYQAQFFNSLKKIFEIKVIFIGKKLKNYNFKLKRNNFSLFLGNSKNNIMLINKNFKIFNPDTVIIGGYKVRYSKYLSKLSITNKTKIIYWLEKINFKNNLKKILVRFALNFFLKNADGILAVGKEAKSFYSKFNNNVINFPYSIKVNHFRKKFFKKKKINFLYVGQMIERKNILNLIEAFKLITSENITLILVGDGQQKNIIKSKIKDDKRIKIRDFKNDKILKSFFMHSDIFVLPSKYDGWGVVITEAMSYNNSIITTSTSGVSKDLIKNNFNGKIVNPSIKSIKEGMIYYIKNKKLIKKHGNKNKKIISKSKSNTINAVKNLEKFLKKIN